MNEHDLSNETDRGTDTLLTPKSTAITAFTLAVLAMTGQGTWTQWMWGTSFPESRVPAVLMSWSAATLLLAAGAFLLGRRALRDATADGWEGHLARAGMLVAALAGVLAVLAVLVRLVAQSLGYY